MNKLRLIARVKISTYPLSSRQPVYNDPVLDFFQQYGNFKIEDFGDEWRIYEDFYRKNREGSYAVIFYAKEGGRLELEFEHSTDDRLSFMTNALFSFLPELAEQISSGDLTKLPEFAGAYLKFEELAFKSIKPSLATVKTGETLGDPILDFFRENENFKVGNAWEDEWCISRYNYADGRDDGAFATFYYNSESKNLEFDESIGGQLSLIASALFNDHIPELVEYVNNGDLSKLQELADTYLKFEELAFKSMTTKGDYTGSNWCTSINNLGTDSLRYQGIDTSKPQEQVYEVSRVFTAADNLMKLAQEFAATQNLANTEGRCADLAKAFAQFLGTKGVQAKIIDARDYHGSLKTIGKSNHVLAAVGNSFVDFSMQQFDPSAKPIIIGNVSDLHRDWGVVNIYSNYGGFETNFSKEQI